MIYSIIPTFFTTFSRATGRPRDPYLKNYTDHRKMQRFALATQYYATNGDEWLRKRSWLDYTISECSWEAIYCNSENQLVLQEFANNNMQGSPPNEGQFDTLRRVDYSNNSLQGGLQFPSSSHALEELIYSNNNFVGPVVVEGGYSFAKLRVLKLDGNGFSGSIHKGFSFFPELRLLNLTSNQFVGTVPAEVQYLPKLVYFSMARNFYRGTIPSEFGLLTSLEHLDLSFNDEINGTLPTELGSLHLLTQVDIRGTPLQGNIPTELCSRQASGQLEILANCSRVNCCG